MRDLERRIVSLEKPLSGPCLDCDMAELNRSSRGDNGLRPPCNHTQRSNLERELRKLNTTEHAS